MWQARAGDEAPGGLTLKEASHPVMVVRTGYDLNPSRISSSIRIQTDSLASEAEEKEGTEKRVRSGELSGWVNVESAGGKEQHVDLRDFASIKRGDATRHVILPRPPLRLLFSFLRL